LKKEDGFVTTTFLVQFERRRKIWEQ